MANQLNPSGLSSQPRSRIVELIDNIEVDDTSDNSARSDNLPSYLSSAVINLFHDELETITSQAQKDVEEQCIPLLTGDIPASLPVNSHGIPSLCRDRHASFLHDTLRTLPAPFVAADASRPWFFYWALAGLSALGVDVSEYRTRLIETVRPLQNRDGGFGGGHGQLSHCACSYATVLALACVDALDAVDRRAMWHWLGTVKQADGGFCLAFGAEEDIRGAYCAMTIITLLNLPLALPPDAPARKAGLELFTDGLGDWIGRCQTFEGGIAGAPDNEAHGAYAFCALACLCIMDAPSRSIPTYLNIETLIHCLASLQTTPEGGFAGRTNKLVDACYSHWVGGCWALLDAATGNSASHDGTSHDQWNRAALVRYLLSCCQSPSKKGGLRDKPSTRPDGYHTCYSLSGLSAAQYRYAFDAGMDAIDAHSGQLKSAFAWSARSPSQAERDELCIDESDVVDAVHPVFAIPLRAVEAARLHFAEGRF